MKTLIELLDEQMIHNVLSTESFSPDRTVFLCDRGAAHSEKGRRLARYFEYRGFSADLIFRQTKTSDVQDILTQLEAVTRKYPDCALDVTGGSDLLLFAAGLYCANHCLPVFSYDAQERVFRNVHQAEEFEGKPCPMRLSVPDCLVLAGGAQIEHLRGSQAQRPVYEDIDAIWKVYTSHLKGWNRHVKYLQAAGVGADGLSVSTDYQQGRGQRANVGLLEALGHEGLLLDLEIADRRVSFRYKDMVTRRALTDVGLCLELFVYKTARDMNFFDDVQMSTLVDWNGVVDEHNNLYNEIDVVAVRGARPVFISCKTCALTPASLNELKVLTHRFGGRNAKALLATMDSGSTPSIFKRAAALGLTIVDKNDLLRGRLPQILRRAVGEE